jgi:hypothetical protein
MTGVQIGTSRPKADRETGLLREKVSPAISQVPQFLDGIADGTARDREPLRLTR